MSIQPEQLVYIIDDDDAVRDSLLELLDTVDIKAQGYPSAQAFLDQYDQSTEGCLVLDVRMPGMSGLELQQRLVDLGSNLPIIFITSHGDIPMAVEAMKHGAIEFIQKPFRDQELLDCIHSALQSAQQEQQRHNQKERVLAQLAGLTTRENEILNWIVDGHANKVIAIELGISQRTVEKHRATIMQKMGVKSTAALIKATLSVNPNN